MLIVAVDVDYRGPLAVAAGLWFRGWAAAGPEHRAVDARPDVAGYEPGAFYKRELPALLAVLARGPRPDVVVIDGYVWLAGGDPGLGARLHAAVGGAVVGVAKTRYAGAAGVAEVRRGASRSPLFVSAVGMPVEDAAAGVAAMGGPYRVPALLKATDALARTVDPADWAGVPAPGYDRRTGPNDFPQDPARAGPEAP